MGGPEVLARAEEEVNPLDSRLHRHLGRVQAALDVGHHLGLEAQGGEDLGVLAGLGEATGVVTSMYSMPNSSRALAISTLSWVEKFAFSNCSPSRKVESIIFHSRMHPSPKENRPEPAGG